MFVEIAEAPPTDISSSASLSVLSAFYKRLLQAFLTGAVYKRLLQASSTGAVYKRRP
jgi:hypothetical protein